MPELPDLEAYRINLERLILHKEVVAATIHRPSRVAGTQEEMNRLVSARLASLGRSGKEMLLCFDNGMVLGVHLMLQGRFEVTSDEKAVQYKIFSLDFPEEGLVVADPRGWAKIRLNPAMPAAPDAFDPAFSLAYFRQKLQEAKAKSVKAVLVDQDVVRGIGNAYSDEILWEARIAPHSAATKLPDEAVEALFTAIRRVLLRSIEEILAVDPAVISGEIRDFMRVHHKDKTTSPGGFAIKTKKIASKKSYFTEEQVLYL